jgi:EAL domain-containing protein (putative c-di-GMP-specific phosphodiesterase class I)
MYRAKNLGKARHQEFDTAMHALAMRQLLLETDLRRALERNELRVHYQPVVAVDTREVRGFEALIRWLHPQWGLVPQGEFLPLAEETGLIVPIGSWVLETACRDLAEWRRSPGGSKLTMSVNLSGRQLVQPQLVDSIMNALEETGLAADGLRLEITESAIMEHVDAASSALQELCDRGIEIDLDDFGTGYSSLSYLHRFPISRVKIDRSFVSRLRDENQAREIVRAIVRLADSLGMEAVAEGVEHEEDARIIREMECPLAQGYLYGRPVDRAATDALLKE